jgi:hypothetical protein
MFSARFTTLRYRSISLVAGLNLNIPLIQENVFGLVNFWHLCISPTAVLFVPLIPQVSISSSAQNYAH